MATRICPHCGVKGAFGLGAEQRPFDPAAESFIHLEICRNGDCGGAVAVVTRGSPVRECQSFPSVEEDVTDLLSSGAKTAYQQARQSMRAGIYDGAVLMCLRSLGEAAMALGAKGKTLEDQIQSVIKDEGVSGTLREWAHSGDLRAMLKSQSIGSGRHQAEELLEFCDRFFDYAFVFPGKVRKSRRCLSRDGGARPASLARSARVSGMTR